MIATAIAATIDIARTGDVRAAPSPVKNDESASFMTSGPQLRKQPCQSFLTRVTGSVDESHTCTHRKLKGGSGQSYPRRSKGSACRCYLPVLTGLADFRRADPRRQRLPPRASIASTHRTFHLSVMHTTVSVWWPIRCRTAAASATCACRRRSVRTRGQWCDSALSHAWRLFGGRGHRSLTRPPGKRAGQWRRGRDSNPRDGFSVYTLSRRACSTAPAPLHGPAEAATSRAPRSFLARARRSLRH